MSATNLELIQYALLKINVVDENSAPSAEQGVTGLNVLNDMMANMSANGIKLGWYPQTNMAATSPLQSQDVGPIKYLLCAALAAHYGLTVGPLLIAEIEAAGLRLAKTSLRYSEADLSELPRQQGTFGGGWF
jgi:hypothetical protein